MPKLSINIDVDDLDRGVAFYEAAVGLTPARRFGGFAVELVGGEAPVYLLLKAPATPPFPGAESRRDYARHWTPVHVDFVVEEIAQARARAVAAGARVESEIESYRWGRVVLMSDPFGNGFCLVEIDAQGFDETATPYVRAES
jgi:predicted enzyme related to lactoylglutathione lyase